jgi:hypothetical protein
MTRIIFGIGIGKTYNIRLRYGQEQTQMPWKLNLCREGLFLLPYNELAVAQGPNIYQKNEL